jgi:hypothetical protein
VPGAVAVGAAAGVEVGRWCDLLNHIDINRFFGNVIARRVTVRTKIVPGVGLVIFMAR